MVETIDLTLRIERNQRTNKQEGHPKPKQTTMKFETTRSSNELTLQERATGLFENSDVESIKSKTPCSQATFKKGCLLKNNILRKIESLVEFS